MSELQKRQSELEMELTEATKKECTTKMEVEKLENELGMKTEEIKSLIKFFILPRR